MQINTDNSQIKTKTKRSEKIYIQQRDVDILKFLDRVGYANVAQIAKATGTDGNIKAQNAVLRRLYLLRRFKYIKIFSTHHGNYYALDTIAQGDNRLITSIKLDQLVHHDYLINLFLNVQQHDNSHEILSEREVISKLKIVGKSGKIPDMIINNWIIEYERTNKSAKDCSEMLMYWMYNQNKHVCIIYETEEIKNRYTKLINENNNQVQLVNSNNIDKILQIITQKVPETKESDVLKNLGIYDNKSNPYG